VVGRGWKRSRRGKAGPALTWRDRYARRGRWPLHS
jgi:hypothetical protein